MFVATSDDEEIARGFMKRARSHHMVLWIFHFDHTQQCPCLHVNLIDRHDGNLREEREFLFAPYSAFTVRKAPYWQEPTSGFKCYEVGAEKPKQGEELRNWALAEALQSRTEFTLDEWAKFGINQLKGEEFIKSGANYFRPAGPISSRHLIIELDVVRDNQA
eukprot:1188618-Prymnesium_polylepis.2